MSDEFTVDGLDTLNEGITALPGRALQAAVAEMSMQAEVTMTAAKKEAPVAVPEMYTPSGYKRLTPGALQASGQVQGPIMDGDQVVFRLSFGNNTAYYALFVHEILTARHIVGKAKYLEDPVNARSGAIIDAIAEALAGGLQ